MADLGALPNVLHLNKPNLDIAISSANLSMWKGVSPRRPRILSVISELILGVMSREWTF